MSATPVKRPGGVTLLGVLVIISGILYVITGLIALIAYAGSGSVGTTIESTGNQRIVVLVVGIAILLFGLIELAVARGLFRGSPGARIIVAIVNVLTIISGLVGAFQSGNQRGTSIGQVIIAIIVLALLYSPKANEFFARGGATANTY